MLDDGGWVEMEQGSARRAVGDVLLCVLIGGISNVISFTVIEDVRLVKVMEVEIFGEIGSDIGQNTIDVSFEIVFQGREEAAI